jgi:ABC-2 type transport system ATP-binding protein
MHVADSTAASSQLIELHGLTRTFGSFTALSNVNLSLPPGRIGLLGPNGAGKSTLLKILMGLIAPTSGRGRVLDEELGADRDSAGNWRLRGLIGFMPEADALVPGLTGIEYVSLAGELYGMSRREAQRRAHEVLSYLELEEARYRRVEQYSMGMKQRAKLAQALVHDPPVLLLDEPTSGLDPSGRDAMLRLIRTLGAEYGKSVILSTHLLADVEAVCERVVIIAGGRVRGQGTVAELCTRREDRFRLRVQGEPSGFRSSLRNRGVTLLADNGHGEWRISVPAGWKNLAFFELARAHAVVIRSLIPDDETLEELFLRTVSDATGAA